MKKMTFLTVLLVATAWAGLCSCSGCKGETQKTDGPAVTSADYDGVVPDFNAGVSHIQALHRQTMYGMVQKARSVDGGYEWRNSKVLFSDSITARNIDGLHVTSVTDVYYYWDKAKGPQVQFIASDVKKGTLIPPAINDVWIEDADMSEKEVRLSAEDVLERLKQWNGVLPPAVGMSLRYPVGPCECNAQWVLGDAFDVIFVDAVTGDISNWNPAFNPRNKARGGYFGKPLGEWP